LPSKSEHLAYLEELFKKCPFILKELHESFTDHALFIVDPFDLTVNKGNTVIRGREQALFEKMLETLEKSLLVTGRLVKEEDKKKEVHKHKFEV
jgi:hypothetical protein